MNIKYLVNKKIALLFFLLFFNLVPNAISAEKLSLVKGIFSKSITIYDLETFAEQGIRKGFLKKIIKEEEAEKVSIFLTKEYNAPILLTSKLLNSEIGNRILIKASKIVHTYRLKDKSLSILAIRASVIKALDEGNEKISILSFLKAYPSQVVAIDITELEKVVNNVESVSELIKFYSNSPLEKLKK